MKVGDIVFFNTPHKAMRHAKVRLSDVKLASKIFRYKKGRVYSMSDKAITVDIEDTDYRLTLTMPIREGFFKEKNKC